MDGSAARVTLARLIDEQGADYARLSRMLGRNAAYIQQYIKRGTPRRLAEEDRRLLARFFGVPEEMLGGPTGEDEQRAGAMLQVPRLDVGASAGPGAVAGEERAAGHMGFDPAWLKRIGADPKAVSVIRVAGDSMAPTLADGDEILVDRGDGAERLRDGIYVLRIEDALVVKRVALHPAQRSVAIRSDNDAYPSWPECDPGSIEVVGRVVWVGRRLR